MRKKSIPEEEIHTRRKEISPCRLEISGRRLERGQEDDEDWNLSITEAWQEQKRCWRDVDTGDDQEAERYGDKIYSPPTDTREGKEKKERREKVEKAGKLTERWQLMRECRSFLEKHSETWQKRTEQE